MILVDADIVAYRAAATAEDKAFGIAYSRACETLEKIAQDVGVRDMRLFISGEPDHNFRKLLYPEYKANRTAPAPKWLNDIKEKFVLEWNAEIMDGCEADDGLSMNQTSDTIIASIDKDLLQIPGNHYNWVTEKMGYVSEIEGMRNFYRHCMVGDSSDNIKGVKGIGPVKAGKMLDPIEDPDEMFAITREAFNDDAAFLLAGQLIWCWREEGGIWNPPQLRETAISEG